MYNRYIRGDSGQYQRIPVPDPPVSPPPPPPPPPENGGYRPFSSGRGPQYGPGTDRPPPPPPPPPGGGKRNGILSGILSRLHLEHIDTGDLLLLLIILLLFQDGEDEEILIALGLLLIL